MEAFHLSMCAIPPKAIFLTTSCGICGFSIYIYPQHSVYAHVYAHTFRAPAISVAIHSIYYIVTCVRCEKNAMRSIIQHSQTGVHPLERNTNFTHDL